MSFLGKFKSGLKSLTDRVTGDYGEITVLFEKDKLLPGEVLKGQVRVTALADLKVTEVVAKIEGLESVHYRDENFEDEEGPGRASCSHSDWSLRLEQELSSEMLLEEGDSKSFELRVSLPEDLPPSYLGEHLKNHYWVEVRVDVPWGKDLVAKVPFSLVQPRPKEQFHEIRTQQSTRLCRAELVVPRSVLRLGEELDFSLKLAPTASLKLEQVRVELLSLEGFLGQVSRESCGRVGDSEDLGPGDEEERLDWNEQPLLLVVDKDEQSFWCERVLEDTDILEGSLPVREGFGFSYQRAEREHRLVLRVQVEMVNGPPLKFEQELLVHGGEPGFEEALEIKWGTRAALPVRSEERGYVNLRVWGRAFVKSHAKLDLETLQAEVRNRTLTSLSKLSQGTRPLEEILSSQQAWSEQIMVELREAPPGQEWELLSLSVDLIQLV